PLFQEDHRPALAAFMPQVLGRLAFGQERDAAADSAKPTHLGSRALFGMDEIGRDVGCRCRWINGLGDRPADYQDRCSIVERLPWSDHTLLVRNLGTHRANPRNDEESLRPGGLGSGDLGTRTDDPVYSGFARELGEALDLFGGTADYSCL